MKDHPSQWIQSGLSCRDVTERVSEYTEDRLPILTKVRVGLHLASCANCRAYLRQMVLICATVALLPKRSPSSIQRLRLRRQFAAHYSR